MSLHKGPTGELYINAVNVETHICKNKRDLEQAGHPWETRFDET